MGLAAPAFGQADSPRSTLRICHNQELTRSDANEPAFAMMNELLGDFPKLRFEFVALPWARCLLVAASGGVDAVLAVSYKPERGNRLIYPRTPRGHVDIGRRMYRLGYVLVRRSGSQVSWDGHRFSDLDAPLAAQRGYSIIDFARARGAEVDDGNATAEGILAKLELGRVGGLLVSQAHLRDLRALPSWNTLIERVGPLLQEKNYYLAFSPAFYAAEPRIAERLWNGVRRERQTERFRAIFQQQMAGSDQERP